MAAVGAPQIWNKSRGTALPLRHALRETAPAVELVKKPGLLRVGGGLEGGRQGVRLKQVIVN